MRPRPQAPRPHDPRRALRGALLAVLTLATALAAPACSTVGIRIPSGKAEVVGVETGSRLAPRFPTRAYSATDDDTADIYLTDLSADDLTALFENPATSGVSGQIVHLHMFVRPKPGRTPIESTAISATVRYAVIAEGRVGLYAGAGFLFPNGKPGDNVLGGSISKADLRLERATPGFIDRLGPSVMSVSFNAVLDEPLSDELHRRLEVLAQNTSPVENSEADRAAALP
ncbi:MAG: hypothetical protein R3B57_01250 [Phycisphaerales bacterium]